MASAWREAGLGRIHPPLRGGGHQHRDPGRSGAQSRDLRQAGSGYRLRRFREDGLKEHAGVFPRLRGKCQAKPDEGGVSRERGAFRSGPRPPPGRGVPARGEAPPSRRMPGSRSWSAMHDDPAPALRRGKRRSYKTGYWLTLAAWSDNFSFPNAFSAFLSCR